MMFNLQTLENYRDIFTIVIFFKQSIVIVIVPLSPRPTVLSFVDMATQESVELD